MAGRFKINSRGYSYILNADPNIRGVCQRTGNSVCEGVAGHGEFNCDTRSGIARFHTLVKADDFAARKAEHDYHVLSRAKPRVV